MRTLADDIFETMVAVTREHADKLIAQGKIERLERINAELIAALKAMLEQHGKPHRGEWINEAAFEAAKAVDAQARAAIANAERKR